MFANRTCRCGWPKAKAITPRVRTDASSIATGKSCTILGCFRPPIAAKDRCWPHYRRLREREPADRGKGCGCYRGLPKSLIHECANRKKAERQGRKERQLEARELLFGEGRGRIMNLSRKDQLFVRQVSHESHKLYLFRCWDRGITPMSFRAYRRRLYAAQNTNWRRFDVPRVMSRRLEEAGPLNKTKRA